VALAVMALPKHGKLVVPRGAVPHPAQCGLYRSTGLNRKCSGHYRHALPTDAACTSTNTTITTASTGTPWTPP
jgi:hypothetical protein